MNDESEQNDDSMPFFHVQCLVWSLVSLLSGISREEPAEARAKLLALLRGSEEVTS